MTPFSFDEVLKASQDYFDGDDLAAKVFITKYALADKQGNIYEKTPEDMHHRLAKEFARIEAKYPNPLTEEQIFSYLDHFKYIVPQGSPMAGIGNPYQITSISNCFTKGTKTLTTSGVKNIEDVKIGDVVVTHEGREQPVQQTHKNTVNNRKLFSVKCFRTPELTATDNHKFMSITKEQIAWGQKPQFNSIEMLRAGDYIQIPNNKSVGIAKDFNISQLFDEKFEYGDKVYNVIREDLKIKLITKSKSGKEYQHKYFIPQIIKADTDFAYFLGLWYGDGCIFGENTKGTKGHRNRMSKVCSSVRGITFTFGAHENKLIEFVENYLTSNELSFDKNQNNETDGTTQIVINSPILGYAFEMFFGRRFDGKKLHHSIFSWPKEMVKALAQGLIDSDGTITKEGNIRVVLANNNLITSFYHLLRSRGFLVGISDTKGATRLDFGRNDEFRNNSSKSYKDSRVLEELSNKTNHSIQINGETFVQILNKTPHHGQHEFVYTIGVKDDHSYSVEGLLSLNCFVIDSPADSYGGIFKFDQEEAQIMKRRGGVGGDISTIRPRGLHTNNAAKTTDGIAVFMERFSNTCREVAQGGRRGALMLSISVHHPEIETFINIKRDLKKVTGANISIRLSDEFMNAVKNKTDVELRWPVDSKTPSMSMRVDANHIWNQIIESTHASAEPGILFWDTIKKWSPADAYLEFQTVSTNPCLSRDTLIAVADGRNAVSIKQLAEEGKDVPVYSADPVSGMISIKTGRNPRITGYNKKLVRVTLDDGNYFDVTPDHKFMLFDGSPVEASKLTHGDSLSPFTKNLEPVKKGGNLYYRINCNSRNAGIDKFYEHRIIAKYNQPDQWNLIYENAKQVGFAKTGGIVIHHKDYNALNNSPENLQIMTFREHQKFHANLDNAGIKNGRHLDVTNDKIKELAIEYTKSLGRRFSSKEWETFAKANKLPMVFTRWRQSGLGKSPVELAKICAIELGIEYVNVDPRLVRTLNSMLEQGYKANIVNNEVHVCKNCELCKCEFEIEYLRREQSFCSSSCGAKYVSGNQEYTIRRKEAFNKAARIKSDLNRINQAKIYSDLKFNLSRNPKYIEWKQSCKNESIPYRIGPALKYGYQNWTELKEAGSSYNHKVHAVEELPGEHVVYNITVDDNHTVSIVNKKTTRNNSNTYFSGVNVFQCGEVTLSKYDSCRLLLVNTVSFVENPFTPKAKFNYEKYGEVVRVSQRLMDDMIDLELENIDKILAKIDADPELPDVKLSEIELWNKIKNACIRGRRTGLGVTSIGDTVAAMNTVYGSEESIVLIEEVYRHLAVNSYRSSVQMAKERGAFPAYDYESEKAHPFINRIMDQDPELRKDWKKYGRRNIANTTTAPAGSVSILTQTTSGIEPAFMLAYKRRKKITTSDNAIKVDFIDNMGDKWQEFDVYHHWFKKWMKITGKTDPKESPYWGGCSNDIVWVNKTKAQAAAQKWICHSISNTTNVPADTSVEVIKNIYMTGWETGCFVAGSTVNTSNGIKDIERIIVGDMVIGADGKEHVVNEVYDIKPEPRVVAKIKADGLPLIEATADHPIAVLSMIGKNVFKKAWEDREKVFSWKRADAIGPTDYLLVPVPDRETVNKLDHFLVEEELCSNIIVENNKVFPARTLPWKSTVTVKSAAGKPIDNKINIDDDLMTLFGWFIAEGHFSRKSCLRMNFNSITERSLAQKLANIIESKFNCEVKQFETYGNDGISWRIEWHSVLCSRLFEQLFGRGSHNKHLPAWFTKLDPRHLHVMVDTHFSGDAGVTMSRQLAKELFYARLLCGQAPKFKNDSGSGYLVEASKQTGLTGRIFENYFAYKVCETSLVPYYGKVYNFSVNEIDSYTVNSVAAHNCKGITVYRDGSRAGVLLSQDEKKKEEKKVFSSHNAPKRPKELVCDIHTMSVHGEKWTFFVGIYEDKPYEIMGGLSKFVNIPRRVKSGKILKHNGPSNPVARYDLHYDFEMGPEDEATIKDITSLFENAVHSAFTRTISLALRHGTPVQFVVEQIQKGSEKEDDLFSFSKAISRVLKPYIKDGTKVSADKKCPACGSPGLVYREGCSTCVACGNSRCG